MVLVSRRTAAIYAAEYFAHSRSHKRGQAISEQNPGVNLADRALEALERALVGLGFELGEEVWVSLKKS